MIAAPPLDGALLFARFAYPPNALGYCGPDDAATLLECADAGIADGGLVDLARRFEGAWPYLELIAHANGLADPLDRRVVEAYWIGNGLLDAVSPQWLGASLEERFRPIVGSIWSRLAEVVQLEPRPSHGFHVLCVYPWVGLLRTGATDHALHVLDRCRIRWGRVRSLTAGSAIVDAQPLTWDGRRLALGPPKPETVATSDGGRALAPGIAIGDLVACHWDWVCHGLTPGQARRLRAETTAQLHLVNDRLAVSPPAAVLS